MLVGKEVPKTVILIVRLVTRNMGCKCHKSVPYFICELLEGMKLVFPFH